MNINSLPHMQVIATTVTMIQAYYFVPMRPGTNAVQQVTSLCLVALLAELYRERQDLPCRW